MRKIRIDKLELRDQALLDLLDLLNGGQIGNQDGQIEFYIGDDGIDLLVDWKGHLVAVLALHFEVRLQHLVLFLELGLPWGWVQAHGNKFYS